MLVDLTPVIDGTGPARLLDMVAGRSAEILHGWLEAGDPNFRSRVKVVAMDGFAGYHTATADALPTSRAVMDPFYAEVRIMPMCGGLGLVTEVPVPVKSA